MSSIKHFFINQIVWIGISFSISIGISMLVPFPISLLAIVGTFLLLNFYLRKRMITRYGIIGGTVQGSMYSPTATDGGSLRYYCMGCGVTHKQIACPKCGPNMKKVGL
jgi:hypothetical protein